MSKSQITSIILSLAALTAAAQSPIEYVEPRIGTAHAVTGAAGLFGKGTEELGQTLPAVLEPHGMNFWTPQTRDTERKCIAPYYYTDSLFQGFRNSHWIVGGCTQDYGSFTLMPQSGALVAHPEQRATLMDKSREVSRPDYYSIYLPQQDIKAEMTGTSRAAIFRFDFADGATPRVLVNPNSDEGLGFIAIDRERRMIYGYNPVHRIYQGWGEPAGFSGYFVAVFDRDATATVLSNDKERPFAAMEFKPTDGPVLVKAASSFTSIENALENLEAEIPGWDFDAVQKNLAEKWNDHLGQIKVETPRAEDKKKFYSALYRSSFLPRTFNDVDGSYPTFSSGQPVANMPEGQNYYEDFSMWDTYRAEHPLITLLSPTRSGQMMQSLVTKYRQGGWLPIFPCWNSYTSAMIGDHCIAAIADAYVKGVDNFDIESAYEGMRQNAFRSPFDFKDYENGMGRRALPSYLKYGYIPLEDSVKEAFHKQEQVSRTLEYAFDDYALAQVAQRLGRTSDYDSLMARSKNYRHVIDPQTGYARGRHADGSWKTPFDPVAFDKSITEGAPCHYTWYVPHDIPGLIDAMGGREAFVARLDSMFSERRYWHGNEPCHQVAWLYDYVDEPWKSQQALRHIIDTEYLNIPGGLSGNDDAGQMSAWLVFAAMGFYPVCPATDQYALGSPIFPRYEIRLENGKTFTVIARNWSPENIYVESVKLNGQPHNSNFITHSDILNGSTLEFQMSPSPRK